jgi:hypothetical protein
MYTSCTHQFSDNSGAGASHILSPLDFLMEVSAAQAAAWPQQYQQQQHQQVDAMDVEGIYNNNNSSSSSASNAAQEQHSSSNNTSYNAPSTEPAFQWAEAEYESL